MLSAYDDLIANNKRRIELLERSARLLYREWFVRLKYPGNEHDKLIDGVPVGWRRKKLAELIRKLRATKKIKKEDFKAEGATPCVDQSQEFIGGYTDDPEARIEDPLPVIVFGDHTRILKYVEFPFARGADGTQLIYPNDERISVSFLFYSIGALDISNYFYARHFKFLKDQNVVIPADDLMRRFTDIASENLKQVSLLRKLNWRLAEARDLLLPRLMDGRISV